MTTMLATNPSIRNRLTSSYLMVSTTITFLYLWKTTSDLQEQIVLLSLIAFFSGFVFSIFYITEIESQIIRFFLTVHYSFDNELYKPKKDILFRLLDSPSINSDYNKIGSLIMVDFSLIYIGYYYRSNLLAMDLLYIFVIVILFKIYFYDISSFYYKLKILDKFIIFEQKEYEIIVEIKEFNERRRRIKELIEKKHWRSANEKLDKLFEIYKISTTNESQSEEN